MSSAMEPFSKGTRGPFETLVLRDKHALVELIPARGGIVSRFCVEGREVLYMDEGTLFDVTKNVRGGVPVLFPIAGKLTKDTLQTHLGPRTIAQHGFARKLPWELLPLGDGPSATLRLVPDESALGLFPYDGFDLRVTYALRGDTLAVTTELRHRCTTDLPLHLGFHPYFALPPGSKGSAWVVTDATRAWNNRAGAEEPFAGWAFGEEEVDLHLLDHGVLRPDGQPGTSAVLSAAGRDLVRLDLDPVFATLVVWTLPGRDFVCVEPWTGPADAPNTELAKYLHRRDTFRGRWSVTAL